MQSINHQTSKHLGWNYSMRHYTEQRRRGILIKDARLSSKFYKISATSSLSVYGENSGMIQHGRDLRSSPTQPPD